MSRRGAALALSGALLAATAAGAPPSPKITRASCGDPGEEIAAECLALLAPPLPPWFVQAGVAPPLEAQVQLGRRLFFYARLSRSGQISCASCHDLPRYGVDGEARSLGHGGRRSLRNAPSVYNAAGHFAQFWDGRAKDVERQALGPLLSPIEMAARPADVLRTLHADATYVADFSLAFPDEVQPLSLVNLGRAIGALERTLTTPARWDRYLAGERGALSQQEKEGLRRFFQLGCPTCHMGTLLGGTSFQRLGLSNPWTRDHDTGRQGVTKRRADRQVFKVPSLRNVARTGPYFHDGSCRDLGEAVRLMAWHQLGERASDADVALIVGWLDTLTGELPQEGLSLRR